MPLVSFSHIPRSGINCVYGPNLIARKVYGHTLNCTSTHDVSVNIDHSATNHDAFFRSKQLREQVLYITQILNATKAIHISVSGFLGNARVMLTRP